jgi:hypothetical protein
MSTKEDDFTDEVLESIGELNPKKVGRIAPVQYKLGEEIAYDVKYWGQDKIEKENRTAMCICPVCEKLWRVRISYVLAGKSKSCCRSMNGGSLNRKSN